MRDMAGAVVRDRRGAHGGSAAGMGSGTAVDDLLPTFSSEAHAGADARDGTQAVHCSWIDADVGRFDHLTHAADFFLDDAAKLLRGVRRGLKR